MILENIRNFDWYNEPQNVQFMEKGLLIETKPHTDFWQNADNRFYKDDGHLFSEKVIGDFTATAKWHFPKIKDSAQCGIMVRGDEQNWLKVGLLSPNPYRPQIGVVTAIAGASDWSVADLPAEVHSIWFKLKRRSKDFVVYWSANGKDFEQIRMAHLSKIANSANVGAYACSPKDEAFECILEEISIEK